MHKAELLRDERGHLVIKPIKDTHMTPEKLSPVPSADSLYGQPLRDPKKPTDNGPINEVLDWTKRRVSRFPMEDLKLISSNRITPREREYPKRIREVPDDADFSHSHGPGNAESAAIYDIEHPYIPLHIPMERSIDYKVIPPHLENNAWDFFKAWKSPTGLDRHERTITYQVGTLNKDPNLYLYTDKLVLKQDNHEVQLPVINFIQALDIPKFDRPETPESAEDLLAMFNDLTIDGKMVEFTNLNVRFPKDMTPFEYLQNRALQSVPSTAVAAETKKPEIITLPIENSQEPWDLAAR